MSQRSRRTVEVRREEILSTTIDIIERVGLADTRVIDVASALGVSTSLVFYHFGSKDDLVAESFAHAFGRDLEELDHAVRGHDPLRKLRRLTKLFDTPGAPVGWSIWIDACAAGQREPAIREKLQWLDRRYAVAIRAVVEEGVATGVFTCADPAASAARVLALNDGLSTAVVLLRSITRRQLRDLMTAQIATEVGIDVRELRSPRVRK